ncbi:unnamed protein product [Cuscuta europaea]|uniref:3'-5' exonuclease domain-containing protein n=1 Tax=Cuscuta europaea TaxID=41803 RepID=A0A9P0Z557_CUSEU|nr:unnamed protein product [Cuscuta europaea]
MSTSLCTTFNSTNGKYYVQCAGKTIETTVTKRGAAVSDWVRDIRSKHAGKLSVVVGLDREWRPNTAPNFSNKTATLQLCVEEKCLIFQLLHADEIPDALKRFMSDSTFAFVGVEVTNDVGKLREEYGLACGKSVDIVELARTKFPGKFNQQGVGLTSLAKEICGVDVTKPEDVRRSDWAAAELSSAQVQYASIDAYASFRVGQSLLQGN